MEIRNRSKNTQILVKNSKILEQKIEIDQNTQILLKIIKYWNGNLKWIQKTNILVKNSKILEWKLEIDQKIHKFQ